MPSRQDLWEQNYRIRPYLANSTFDELSGRANELFNNLFEFGETGKITPTDREVTQLLMERMAHLNLEYIRRKKSVVKDARYERENFWHRPEVFDILKRNKAAFSRIERTPHTKFKFGKAEHLISMYESGEILLSAASDFRSIENDPARQDDELSITTYITPYDYELDTIDPYFKKLYPAKGWLKISYDKPTNFYLFCLTSKFNPRFFGDFSGANACLAIHDASKMVERMSRVLAGPLSDWRFYFKPCLYIDPYFMVQQLPSLWASISVMKTTKYMYQRECRFVAIPPVATSNLAKLKISIGPLKDIASLFILD